MLLFSFYIPVMYSCCLKKSLPTLVAEELDLKNNTLEIKPEKNPCIRVVYVISDSTGYTVSKACYSGKLIDKKNLKSFQKAKISFEKPSSSSSLEQLNTKKEHLFIFTSKKSSDPFLDSTKIETKIKKEIVKNISTCTVNNMNSDFYKLEHSGARLTFESDKFSYLDKLTGQKKEFKK